MRQDTETVGDLDQAGVSSHGVHWQIRQNDD